MGYSGAGGKLIHEKNQKQKISWHCPFKEKHWSLNKASRKVSWYFPDILKISILVYCLGSKNLLHLENSKYYKPTKTSFYR